MKINDCYESNKLFLEQYPETTCRQCFKVIENNDDERNFSQINCSDGNICCNCFQNYLIWLEQEHFNKQQAKKDKRI